MHLIHPLIFRNSLINKQSNHVHPNIVFTHFVLPPLYKTQKRVEEYPEIPTADGVIVGSYHCSLFCKLSLSFVKELPRYRTLRKQDFNCREHLLREIAYIKDEIVRKTF
nr:MAG TPA: hypothetical protein [Caudoviricetes sp.]